MAHTSVANSKPKVALDSHAVTRVLDDNYLVIHDHNSTVYVYSYDPRDGHRSAKTVDIAVGYHDPQSGKKYILMINQAIHIKGLENHLLCPMQCHLNGVHISEVSKFLADSPSVITHAIQLADPSDAAHPLTILLWLSSMTHHFYVYSLSIAEYENEEISQFHLTAEEPPWNPSMEKIFRT